MSLANNIRQLCDTRGIKLETLGRELGLGEKAIYKWDKSSPKTETLQKVADYFNVSIDHLVYGFNRPLFAATLLLLKQGRTIEQFSKDTNIDISELNVFLESIASQPPSIEIVEKLIADNHIGFMITAEEVYNHAGYDAPEQYKNQTPSYTVAAPPKSELDETETELLRIFNALSIRGKAVLLSHAYELEEEENKKDQHL